MIKDLTFITGNKHKAEQVAKYLGIKIKQKDLDLLEIQSLNPLEIIEHKTRAGYKKIKSPVLVEDVSMTFKAFGALPGKNILVVSHGGILRALIRFLKDEDLLIVKIKNLAYIKVRSDGNKLELEETEGVFYG